MAYTDISGKKLQSKMGAILNESATSHSPALLSSQQSFAKRQLEKMGWTEGTGLGKNRNGIKDHVKIKQREDEMGLGREKELANELGDFWWKYSVGGTLARLQQQKKKKADKKKSKKDKKKSSKKESSTSTIKTFTDEELFAATGGARFGMRAQRRAEGKWKRTESGTDLAEMEKKALKSMEWNGRGNAQVVVDGEGASATNSSSKMKKRVHAETITEDKEEDANLVSPSISSDEEEEEEEDANEVKEMKKKNKKKRRKLDKESHQISFSPSEVDDSEEGGGEESKEKKKKSKKKKEKKSKKSSKK
eukprot:CAMPEP_0184420302 /NCGR_PEP_ID=MMETSP0738-20130409/47453_1 /TAXON_ID=385413 /ORGANISM="Thalassiosira miniscula, Strain CCMP1093" /LENGTH=305 /DNA_ID=CAMNT_0026781143 /DNA_START=52 /DNA_END=969 /DNA_ORIENTATION=+